MTKHHEVRDTDPLPIRSLSSAAHLREIAIASIARDEECTLEEAALRLDTTPAAKGETSEQLAERRRAAERDRIVKQVRDLAMPVQAELIPQLVLADCMRTRSTHEAAEWMRSTSRVLVLIGDVGVGKTVAACLCAVAYARRRKTTAYVREPTLVRWWHSTTLAHEQRVQHMREVDLLIVDELGTTLTREAERARDAVFGMLDDRIAERRATIFAGNLAPDRLATAYGARFLDRLREVGRVAHVTGPSLRGLPR